MAKPTVLIASGLQASLFFVYAEIHTALKLEGDGSHYLFAAKVGELQTPTRQALVVIASEWCDVYFEDDLTYGQLDDVHQFGRPQQSESS
jgi:hypothetical protein